MYIIKKTAYEDDGRPPLQTWDEAKPPEGYAICPDEFCNVFYSTNPAGFVNITVEGDTVTTMTVNEDAYNAYVAEKPITPDEPTPTEPEPTADEILNALLGV